MTWGSQIPTEQFLFLDVRFPLEKKRNNIKDYVWNYLSALFT